MRAVTISILAVLCGLFAQETTATESCLNDLGMHNGQERLQVAIRNNDAELVKHLVIRHGASLERALEDAIQTDDKLVYDWIVEGVWALELRDRFSWITGLPQKAKKLLAVKLLGVFGKYGKFRPSPMTLEAPNGSATRTRAKWYDLSLQVAIRNNDAELVKHLVLHHGASLERALEDAFQNHDQLVHAWISEGFAALDLCKRFSWMTGFPQIEKNLLGVFEKYGKFRPSPMTLEAQADNRQDSSSPNTTMMISDEPDVFDNAIFVTKDSVVEDRAMLKLYVSEKIPGDGGKNLRTSLP